MDRHVPDESAFRIGKAPHVTCPQFVSAREQHARIFNSSIHTAPADSDVFLHVYDGWQPFMSGFISSLLIELGLRQDRYRSRQPSSQPQAGDDLPESSESIQPKTVSSCDRGDHVVVERSRDRGGQELKSGDAGSLHGSAFFTTVHKEMDGRSMEPDIPRTVAETGATDNDVAREVSSNMDLGAVHSRRLHSAPLSESTNSLGEPQMANSNIASQASNSAEIDEPVHSLLPADDGMGVMRRKIHAIRELTLSNAEKARMVHSLMTENYKSSRQGLAILPDSLPLLRKSPAYAQLPVTQTPRQSGQPFGSGLITAALASWVSQHDNSFSLTAEDLQPTFASKIEPEAPVGDTGDEDLNTEEQEKACLGCRHYKRNVKLQCHTCKRWYTCRFCHDEVENHHLIRRQTENMLCMLCGHAQPAAHVCRQCGEQTAHYYCDICKLWDNDTKKSIYHCTDCGICRIGQGLGRDFFHCKV